jgi:hypothetical protein
MDFLELLASERASRMAIDFGHDLNDLPCVFLDGAIRTFIIAPHGDTAVMTGRLVGITTFVSKDNYRGPYFEI